MPQTALALKDPPAREYANALAPGTVLLEYRLEQVLGAGGFGITYLGWDTHLEKHVAIKEYLPAQLAVRALDGSIVPIATEQKYDYVWGLERFVLEARTLARFSHPHIVRVNRYIEANATAYMVMDYEAGMSLSQWLADNPQPTEEQLKAVVLPILAGLDAVHAQGFLHRDIKPSNLFMRENGTPVLLDFGAARQAIGHRSMSLTSIVSPGYAPLEQYASDGNQGPWSDVYSLSAVLYRATTGENPPEAVSRMRFDRVRSRLDRVADRYSSTFLKAVALGMAVDEKLRPQSVSEWREVLLGQGRTAAERTGARTVAVDAVAAEPVGPHIRTESTPRSAAVVPRRDRAAHRSAGVERWRWVLFAMLVMVAAGVFLRGGSDQVVTAAVVAPERRIPVAHPAPAETAPAVPLPAETAPAVPLPAETASAAPMVQVTTPPEAQAPVPQIARAEPAPSQSDSADRAIRADRSSTGGDTAQPLPKVAPYAKPPLPKGPGSMMRDFERADRNGDGALSLTEAREGMPRLARDFDRIDVNGDGRVTPVELQRHLRAGPAPRQF